MIAGKTQKPKEVSGTITRVVGPIHENGDNIRMFILDDSAKVYRVNYNGNYSASDSVAFLIEKGDKVTFTCHQDSRNVKTIKIDGLKSED